MCCSPTERSPIVPMSREPTPGADARWSRATRVFFPGDGDAGGVVNFIVTDVDALHAEFVQNGVRIELEPTDQTWGNREMYVEDTDGNSVRFVQCGSN